MRPLKRPPSPGRKALLASALASIAFAASPASSPAELTEAGSQARYVPGEVLVKFEPSASAGERLGLLRRHDATTRDNLPIPGVRLVGIDGGETVAEAVATLEAEPGVAFAEPNYIYRAQATPNDARFSSLWGLDNRGQSVNGTIGRPDADIDAPEAWEITTGSGSVAVAVVDSGVAYDHPDLAPNIRFNPGEAGGGKETNGIDDDGNGFVDDWRGWDFVGDGAAGDNEPLDFHGHGTHVAGTIGAAGNNGYGVTGVAWTVGMIPIRVLAANGTGTLATIAAGLRYAIASGASIVNVSLGGPASGTMKTVIEGAPETLFVAAAGNFGESNELKPQYPCALSSPNVVCVTATDQNDGLASFSNWGANAVDLGAPGKSVLSAAPEHGDPILAEGFENGADDWLTGGINDSWAITDEAKAAGTSSLTDSPGGADYLDGTASWTRHSDTVSLAGQVGCRLSFALRLDTEPPEEDTFPDSFAAEASRSGTWSRLVKRGGTTNGKFTPINEDLSPYDGHPAVGIGFGLHSNASLADDGAYVDEVRVRCLSDAYDAGSFAYLQGTSMAAPHVSGVAALLLASDPSLSAAPLKQRLLASVDPVPALAGKTVTGGRLNAASALNSYVPPPSANPIGPASIAMAAPTPTALRKAASAPSAACAKARIAVAKARKRLSGASKALRSAAGKRKPAARAQRAKARKALAAAQARQRKSCKR